jgi:hypothetical protein
VRRTVDPVVAPGSLPAAPQPRRPQRVAEKCGFALEGTMRDFQLLDDGWHDLHLHARVAGDEV